MDMTFTLDGQVSGRFARPTSLEPAWTYNFSVWDSQNLDNREHNLTVTPLPGDDSSFLALDYFRYQYVFRD